MARKPEDPRQPSLFPDPDEPPEPPVSATPKPDGGNDDVQDDHLRIPEKPAGNARTATPGKEADDDHGILRPGPQTEPRSVDQPAQAGLAGQQRKSDRG